MAQTKKNSHKKYRDMNGAGSIQMLVISSLRWKSPTASIKKWSDLNIKAFFTAQILKFQSRKITNVDNLLDLVTEAATGTPKLLFLLLEVTSQHVCSEKRSRTMTSHKNTTIFTVKNFDINDVLMIFLYNSKRCSALHLAYCSCDNCIYVC